MGSLPNASGPDKATNPNTPPSPHLLYQMELEEVKVRKLQVQVDRVSCLILHSDCPWIDVEIAISEVRDVCERLFPGSLPLFEMIYENRFRRLWQQFREGEAA